MKESHCMIRNVTGPERGREEERDRAEACSWKGRQWIHSRIYYCFITANNPSKGQNPLLLLMKKIGAIAENARVY